MVDVVRKCSLATDLGRIEVVPYHNIAIAVTGLDDLIFPIPPLISTIFFKPAICVFIAVMFVPYFGMSMKLSENIVQITHR